MGVSHCEDDIQYAKLVRKNFTHLATCIPHAPAKTFIKFSIKTKAEATLYPVLIT